MYTSGSGKRGRLGASSVLWLSVVPIHLCFSSNTTYSTVSITPVDQIREIRNAGSSSEKGGCGEVDGHDVGFVRVGPNIEWLLY
jgi:hypothetical protein